MSEKRLIDANALKEKRTVLWDEALGFCDCVLVDDIDNAPTVDAVEVVPSAWKYGTCGKCGFYVGETKSRQYNYCPYCGSIMD